MKKILLLTFITTLFTIGCKEIDESAKNNGKGTLYVHLTDAPAEYTSVLVDVQKLLIKISEDDLEDGWQEMVLDTIGQINLLDYTDGNSILLTEEELPVGQIAQMRMILGPNNEIVVDGDTLALKTPSAEQSGLKFKINATIEEGKTYVLFLDFDAEKSVVSKGNGTYSLKPVITVKTEEEVQESQEL